MFISSVVWAADLSQTSEILEVPTPLKVGEEIPWFALIDAEDGFSPVNRRMLKAKAKAFGAEKIIFSYFATWCLPCRQGTQLLAKAADELKAKKVFVVMMNVGEDDQAKIHKWVNRFGNKDWPVLMDQFEKISKSWGFYKEGEQAALPRTLVLDQDFKVIKFVGQEGNDWPGVLWN